jgi:hypothetical protein
MTENTTTERDLGRVEGKLDLVLLRFTAFEERQDRRDRDHDKDHIRLADRITAVEKRLLVASLTGGGGIAAYVFDAKQFLMGLFH